MLQVSSALHSRTLAPCDRCLRNPQLGSNPYFLRSHIKVSLSQMSPTIKRLEQAFLLLAKISTSSLSAALHLGSLDRRAKFRTPLPCSSHSTSGTTQMCCPSPRSQLQQLACLCNVLHTSWKDVDMPFVPLHTHDGRSLFAHSIRMVCCFTGCPTARNYSALIYVVSLRMSRKSRFESPRAAGGKKMPVDALCQMAPRVSME